MVRARGVARWRGRNNEGGGVGGGRLEEQGRVEEEGLNKDGGGRRRGMEQRGRGRTTVFGLTESLKI